MGDPTPPHVSDSEQTLPTENPVDPNHLLHESQQVLQPDSSSSKPVNLDIVDPKNPIQPEQAQGGPLDEDQHEPENAEDPDAVSIPSSRNSDATAAASTATSRRGHKRKKVGHKRAAQEKKSKRKLEALVETFKPIPFVPSKSLDFSSHEKLLKRLGLWDFVHIEFDKTIRNDLLSQLIASYNGRTRCSYVQDVRILVNRADMARALKLPVKKPVVADGVVEEVESAESIAFIDEFVSTWMLLHEDTWIMTEDVLGFIKMVKDGQLEKVDWARLIWSMVDKELTAPTLVNCYYASHLQQLIKLQKEELLKEGSNAGIVLKDEEDEEEECGSGDVKMVGVDGSRAPESEEGGSGEAKMVGVDESRAPELEEHDIELSLGQDKAEKVEVEREHVPCDDAMDFEETKAEESRDWVFNENQNGSPGRPFVRQCNIGELNSMDCGEEKKGGEVEAGEEVEDEGDEEDAEEDDHEGEFHLPSKSLPLDSIPSGSLFQGMEGEPMPFNTGMELRDYSAGDFLSSREESRMLSGSSLFGNVNRREIDLGNDNHHYPFSGNSKRLRSDDLADKSGEVGICLEQIIQWAEKAKIFQATKEQANEQSTANQQVLLNQLHQRESVIDHLRKTAMEDNQKRQAEVYRLERELYMMGSLLQGYRKALKETQRAFAEYRARYPQQEEALYKDVPGSGGLVLSVTELEKLRMKQEEEQRQNRLLIEKKFKDFEEGWVHEFGHHIDEVQVLEDRLLDLERDVKGMKKVNAKPENHSPECT